MLKIRYGMKFKTATACWCTYLYTPAKIPTKMLKIRHGMKFKTSTTWRCTYLYTPATIPTKMLKIRHGMKFKTATTWRCTYLYTYTRKTCRTLEWMNVLEDVQTSVKPLLKPETLATTAKDERHWYDYFTCKNNNDDDGDEEDDDQPEVMKGWLEVYNSDNPNSQFTKLSARTQILTNIRTLVTKYKDENVSVVVTGHSLGASLAILSAFDLVENGLTKIRVTAIVFGSPQIGNDAFKERLDSFSNLQILHVKNQIDLITHYPSKLLGYAYTRVELVIDTRKSKILKDSKNLSDWHNLQAILHMA
ncbi:hypothetical protein MKX03_028510 [Papaver bracteatum]|nr:hypothetical protein MKX03_028510 [Papaver bracteatum]